MYALAPTLESSTLVLQVTQESTAPQALTEPQAPTVGNRWDCLYAHLPHSCIINTGVNGAQGDTGNPGEIGLPGAAGGRGLTGATGAAGTNGTPGALACLDLGFR